MAIKPKKKGFGMEMKSFRGKDGTSYLVYRTARGAFHVFAEVEAKEAARDCGSTVTGNTQRMWRQVWNRRS